ncbi:MAG: glycosyltransferase, partial [Microbacteriaceae bacterium]|nr:glycosyltransferase [Microbacteriaceae bacterium]
MTSALHRDGDAIETADLSVAMCTRNGARFVAEQVRSILSQSIVPRELVVGDDASTDDTIAVIEAAVAAARAERPGLSTELRVLRRDEPLGVTANFEATIAACTNTLVALSDHDDVWRQGRLARLLPLFDDPSVDLVHTDARLVDEDGTPSGLLLLEALEASAAERRALRTGHAFDVLLRRNLVTGATVILRRSLAETAAPFPPSWLHDEWLA